MLVLSHIRESTWNTEAVAPAFPPDIAFFADLRKTSFTVNSCVVAAAVELSVSVVSALDVSGFVVIMAVAAIVAKNALLDESDKPSSFVVFGRVTSLTFSMIVSVEDWMDGGEEILLDAGCINANDDEKKSGMIVTNCTDCFILISSQWLGLKVSFSLFHKYRSCSIQLHFSSNSKAVNRVCTCVLCVKIKTWLWKVLIFQQVFS